jgi:hypothetical protein
MLGTYIARNIEVGSINRLQLKPIALFVLYYLIKLFKYPIVVAFKGCQKIGLNDIINIEHSSG